MNHPIFEFFHPGLISAPLFSPQDLFISGEEGALIDPNYPGSLFQEYTKTTPSDDPGEVIGAAEDQSGNSNDADQSIAANRPNRKEFPRGGIKNHLAYSNTPSEDMSHSDYSVSSGASKSGIDQIVFDGTANENVRIFGVGRASYDSGTELRVRAKIRVVSGTFTADSQLQIGFAGSSGAFTSAQLNSIGNEVSASQQEFEHVAATDAAGDLDVFVYCDVAATLEITEWQVDENLGSYQKVTDELNITESGVPTLVGIAGDDSGTKCLTGDLTSQDCQNTGAGFALIWQHHSGEVSANEVLCSLGNGSAANSPSFYLSQNSSNGKTRIVFRDDSGAQTVVDSIDIDNELHWAIIDFDVDGNLYLEVDGTVYTNTFTPATITFDQFGLLCLHRATTTNHANATVSLVKPILRSYTDTEKTNLRNYLSNLAGI